MRIHENVVFGPVPETTTGLLTADPIVASLTGGRRRSRYTVRMPNESW